MLGALGEHLRAGRRMSLMTAPAQSRLEPSRAV